MKKVIAFGASSSRQSINKKLATYAASLLENVEVQVLDLNDYEMPIYSIDKEGATGIPKEAQQFKALVQGADGIIISFAEHNGSFSTAFKNVYDWISRIKSENKIWEKKPMLVMATSPGARGGQSVLGHALENFVHRGANLVGGFSLPSFGQNFSEENGIQDADLKKQLVEELQKLESEINRVEVEQD